eukprot:TRINITY_DN8509_c0_g1_i1.p1 TRINITY_DN8509_c0_g1~~TRINITY_DN8509_c0_g1_i1.p1  ORF type:complete len:289 (-),score=73.76 TRINITY_DN8509_c0_g1_i1:39-905(-)
MCIRDSIYAGFKPESSFFESKETAQKHLLEAHANAQALVAEATALIGDVACSIVSVVDLVPQSQGVGEQLVERAAEAEADCIVMGTRGRGEFKSKLFGSVSQAVLNHASQIPVLIVHPGAADTREAAGHSVLFALDGTARSLRSVEQGACFVEEGSAVYLFHAYEEPQKCYISPGAGNFGMYRGYVMENQAYDVQCQRLRQEHDKLKADASKRLNVASSVPVPPEDIHLTLYTAQDPSTGIELLRAKESIDLVVLGSRGETGLRRLSNGSLAHELLHREAPFAVLVIH